MMLVGDTRKFNIPADSESEMKILLTAVYDALKEKGYDPISQIVGYLLSEDPGYIIRHIDRDELLQALVKNYLDIK